MLRKKEKKLSDDDLKELIMPDAREYPTYNFKGEDKFTVEIANFLRRKTIDGGLQTTWFHIPNEGKSNSKAGYKKKAMGRIKGAPDFAFMGKKTCFCVELKIINDHGKKSTQSTSQKLYGKWCEDNGVGYYVAYSEEAVIKVLEDEGVLS